MNVARLIGNCKIGVNTLLDESVIIGYPGKVTQLTEHSLETSKGAALGKKHKKKTKKYKKKKHKSKKKKNKK